MDQIVDIGGNATFTCEALSNYSINFRWLFNGSEVMSDPGRISITTDANTTILIIANVMIDDRGTYICEITSSNTTNTTSLEATLFSKYSREFEKCEYLCTFMIYGTGPCMKLYY